MPDVRSYATAPIRSEMLKEDPSFTELVAQFVEGLQERLRNMENAIRTADFERLRVAAHQLKGSGGGYGYPILTERANDLEKCAKSECVDECIASFAALRDICARVVVND